MIPKVSIIVTTRNRAQHLTETLASFRGLNVPQELPTELLVVDNASTDETAEGVKAARLPQMPVRYLYEPKPGQCNARNCGMSNTRGDVIVFTDDDVRVCPDWIRIMCQPILAGQADAVGGGVTIAPDLRRPWMKYQHRRWLASTETNGMPRAPELIGANMAFSRAVLQKVPGFDVNLGPGALGFADELLFSLQLKRAGFDIINKYEACVEHHFDVSRLRRESFIRNARDRGRSEAYLDYHWAHKSLERLRNKILRDTLRAAFGRFASFVRGEEGCSVFLLHALKRLAYHRQFAVMAGAPRAYSKYGLAPLGR